jgi:hypothetical protein
MTVPIPVWDAKRLARVGASVAWEATMPLATMVPVLTAAIPGSALTDTAVEAASVLEFDIVEVRVATLTPEGT